MEIARTVKVEAPIERVWPLLDDDRNLKLWMPDVIETTYPHGKPEGDPVGTRFIQRIREGGRVGTYNGEVTAYEPARLLGVRLGDDRHFTTDVTYRLSEEGGATRLDYLCRVQLHSWLARIMSVIGAPMTRRIVTRHMAKLKRVAEEGTAR
jgi:uncharacterized protein YndB with AHSA1/START domain